MDELATVCGIDEAGRGPWAGPVCAAAVILDPVRPIVGLADSKTLSARRREILAQEIRAGAICHALGWASAEEIDALNIRKATHLAMQRAVSALLFAPSLALVDGNDAPGGLVCDVRTIVGGDGIEPAISAASILAKTARDAVMLELDRTFPGYGFAAHKGYGTRAHAEALQRLGPCPAHRHSFAPVRAVLGAT